MINKKNSITIILVIALFAVVYLSIKDRSQHGDPVKWNKEHGVIAQRHADLDKFCLDCHSKKFGHTKENFCNSCHKQANVELVK